MGKDQQAKQVMTLDEIDSVQEYYKTRFELEAKWRDAQRKLNQERRELYSEGIVALILALLLVGGITGGVLLNRAWFILTAISGVLLLVFILIYIAYMVNVAENAVANTWRLQGEIAGFKDQQQILDEMWKQGLASQRHSEYYQHILVPQIIEEYQRQSRKNKRFHLILQMTIIITSLVVTGLTSGLDAKLGFNIPAAAPILSLIVSLCTAITGFFKFRERSFHLQQTADNIEQEKVALELGIRHYKAFKNDPHAAFAEFAERIEHLREEQKKRQQQLEQSSDSRETHTTA